MKTQTFFVAAVWMGALATPAFAQELGATRGGGFGAGAEAMLIQGPTLGEDEDGLPGSGVAGPAGAALVYDLGDMRIDGIMSVKSGGGTALGLGGRLLFVLDRMGAADFSLGGGLGVLHLDRNNNNNNDDETNFHIEAVAQIRAFIVSNVALSTTLGFGVNLNDNRDDTFAFGGQFLSSAGMIYYFQ